MKPGPSSGGREQRAGPLERRASGERFPLGWALLYATAAGALFFAAVWVAASALGPAEHHRLWVAGIALALYVPAVLLTLSAGSVLRASVLYARLAAGRSRTWAPAAAALGGVLPAFLDAARTPGRALGSGGSVPLTALAAVALAASLSWLMASGTRVGTLAAVLLGSGLLGAALAVAPPA